MYDASDLEALGQPILLDSFLHAWRAVLDLGSWGIYGDYGCYEDTSAKAPWVAGILGGLAGVGTGAALARTRASGHETSTAVELGSLWGTWFRLASALALGTDEPEEDAALTWALLGGNGGLIASALGAQNLD